MKTYNVTLIPGDGIGPEIAAVARSCIDAALEKTPGAGRIDWQEHPAGQAAIERFDTPMPDSTLQAVRSGDATLKAPVTTPIGTGFRSVNVLLRQSLDLYSCIRPCKLYRGVRSRFEQVDLVVVRENVEDLYAGVEFPAGDAATAEVLELINARSEAKKVKTPADVTGLSIKPISRPNSERILRTAFEYARGHGRRKVTAVHKANIMKHTDGLFKQVAEEVAREYADIEFEQRLIDNMCMQLVQRPEDYDVLVTENLYGDILSDLCAGLVGGLGLAPGMNLGDGGAVFEATHGSAPDIAGENLANPTALLLSGKLMLEHLGEPDAAARLEAAIANVLAEGRFVTADLKPDPADPTAVGTTQMGEAIVEAM
jgi:isocitrate dehydrogenase (NAD+)